MSTLVSLQNVVKRYQRGKQSVEVLHGVNLSIEQGEFLALMGPSGSGKTTLLNLIAGLDQPTEGEVTVAGERIDRLSGGKLAKWRARHIGFVFQFYNLLPVLTAARNVEVPLLLTNLSSAKRKQNVRAVLELVGLADRATHKPSELSGGQQQRVSIARALVADPTLLVCDEPTGDLDRENAEEILKLLQMLNRDQGKTIIMVTHDPLAADHASRTLHVDKGRLIDGARAERRVKYFMLIWAGLWRKKTRTILTMLSIIVAFLLFGLLQGINQGIKAGLGDTSNNRLWTTEPHERDQFHADQPHGSDEDRQRRAQHRALELFRRLLSGREKYDSCICNQHGQARGRLPGTQYHPGADRCHEGDAPRRADRTASGARNMAGKWAIKIPLGTTIWTNKDGSNNWAFDIVGIFDPTPQFARSPLGSRLLDQLRLLGRRRASSTIIGCTNSSLQIDDPKQAAAISSAIDKLTENSPDETRTQTENAALAVAAQATRRHRFHRQLHRRRGHVHAAVPDRQYHDAIGARAHSGTRGPENAGIHRRNGVGAGADRIVAAVHLRRRRGAAALRRCHKSRRLRTRAEHVAADRRGCRDSASPCCWRSSAACRRRCVRSASTSSTHWRAGKEP